MNKIWRALACAAAACVLASCGQGTAEDEAAPDGGGVTVELPEPTAAPASNTSTNEADDADEADEAASVTVAAEAPAPASNAQATEAPAASREPAPEPAGSDSADRASPAEARRDAEAADAPPSLPLPSAVIVRTIEKIGFPCGSIASSSRVGGASGSTDYIINCSSGASYRASNRTGRYRFSKVD